MKDKENKTNVMRILDQKKIPYTAHFYEESDGPEGTREYGVHVARSLGQDPARGFKTLVARGASGGICVFEVPVAENLDLKKAARAVDEKSVELLHVGAPELSLIARIREEKLPCILCINKIDTVQPDVLLPVIAAYNEVWDGFNAIIPISAHTGSGLPDLMSELSKYAQEGPQLFPDGQTSDQPERQVVGEIVREKLLLCLDKEIPHGTAVEITKFSERDSGVIDVDATIYCEKTSHKGIIIGKQGAMSSLVAYLKVVLWIMGIWRGSPFPGV